MIKREFLFYVRQSFLLNGCLLYNILSLLFILLPSNLYPRTFNLSPDAIQKIDADLSDFKKSYSRDSYCFTPDLSTMLLKKTFSTFAPEMQNNIKITGFSLLYGSSTKRHIPSRLYVKYSADLLLFSLEYKMDEAFYVAEFIYSANNVLYIGTREGFLRERKNELLKNASISPSNIINSMNDLISVLHEQGLVKNKTLSTCYLLKGDNNTSVEDVWYVYLSPPVTDFKDLRGCSKVGGDVCVWISRKTMKIVKVLYGK